MLVLMQNVDAVVSVAVVLCICLLFWLISLLYDFAHTASDAANWFHFGWFCKISDYLNKESPLIYSCQSCQSIKIVFADRVHILRPSRLSTQRYFSCVQRPERGLHRLFWIWVWLCKTMSGVGRTGWHIDGSFHEAPFSHSIYHIIETPSGCVLQWISINLFSAVLFKSEWIVIKTLLGELPSFAI